MEVSRLENRFELPSIGEQNELIRILASKKAAHHKSEFGQFLTPLPTARLMASMVQCNKPRIRILDAGAGVGSLFVAVVEYLTSQQRQPKQIDIVAYEVDSSLERYLHEAVSSCQTLCDHLGIGFSAEVHMTDFVNAVADAAQDVLFGEAIELFDIAILNPPYHKIQSESKARRAFQRLGIETSNIYTGFLGVAASLLHPGGELIAITPRSFCNGTYFRGFRKWFLEHMSLSRIHTFHSRKDAFKEDAVLQETIIFRAVRERHNAAVSITTNSGPHDPDILVQQVAYESVVHPKDSQFFIRIQSDDLARRVADQFAALKSTLIELGLQVSTGRVVDFRAKEFLMKEPVDGSVPLIYPAHFKQHGIEWPKKAFKKFNAIRDRSEVSNQLIPDGNYVLVKRFSAKEEKRRIVASLLERGSLGYERIGIENHVNYFHFNHQGIPIDLARGLTAFLNSSIADLYFRQFSGHTQVNATDLRNFRYPSIEQLQRIGQRVASTDYNQDVIDQIISEEALTVSQDKDPIRASRHIEEGLEILRALGLPRAQINERSSLTLLSLVNLKPNQGWNECSAPLMGITPMMEFFADFYGKKYAPNSRETVRRQTIHQFLDGALVVANPDKQDRPVNSPKAVYQIESGCLKLLQSFGTREWTKELNTFLSSIQTLKHKYAQEREMTKLPIVVSENKEIYLSPGGQNILVQQILKEFAPRFTPGGKVIYVGDTETKYAYFESEALSKLGVDLEKHGKMPDVIIHHTSKNWLLLIEAVTSHGPVDAKRKNELKKMFSKSSAGLVFVTTFLTRKAMIEYLHEISWETEVWVADSPTHLIHFNGERFLGPY